MDWQAGQQGLIKIGRIVCTALQLQLTNMNNQIFLFLVSTVNPSHPIERIINNVAVGSESAFGFTHGPMNPRSADA
jgi:hypothetical protein